MRADEWWVVNGGGRLDLMELGIQGPVFPDAVLASDNNRMDQDQSVPVPGIRCTRYTRHNRMVERASSCKRKDVTREEKREVKMNEIDLLRTLIRSR